MGICYSQKNSEEYFDHFYGMLLYTYIKKYIIKSRQKSSASTAISKWWEYVIVVQYV